MLIKTMRKRSFHQPVAEFEQTDMTMEDFFEKMERNR